MTAPIKHESLVDKMNHYAPRFEDLVKDKSGFEQLAAVLLRLTGISLGHNTKNYSLMASRLGRILGINGLKNYKEYAQYLKSTGSAATQEFISALTTNTTQFFREDRHFKILHESANALFAGASQRSLSDLRVWCAACSKGQEAYSLLITLLERENLSSQKVKILASDIDRDILHSAARGVYTAEEMTDVPIHLRERYFNKLRSRGNEPQAFQVKKSFRDLFTFATFNLVHDSLLFRTPFDVIFCRNVLIYFERATSERVVERLASQLRPGGLLFVGHCETGYVRSASLRTVGHAVYEKLEVNNK